MSFELRAPRVRDLVVPVSIDPTGVRGPTRGAARGRAWRRTSPGRYVPAGTPGSVEQRIVEASQRAGARGAVTGWAALRLHGVGFCDGVAGDGRSVLPVPLVEGAGRIRDDPAITVSREDLPESEVRSVHGIRCTSAERALYDEVRSHELRRALVHADMAYAAGALGPQGWSAYLAARSGHVRIRQARRVLDLAMVGSRSPGETLLRLIWVLDAGWPTPLLNPLVTDEQGLVLGMPDLLDAECGLAVEFNGWVHRSRDVYVRDLQKEQAFREVGLETVAFAGPDLDAPAAVVRRLEAARRRTGRSPRRWGLVTRAR
ncbi:hypothetical protein [Nocardioides mangrovi]|uniref:DUF559 domain-containing protein n=1 Tax=Nocardioides mangrovi TaxID=2874580 RepID=A0ABS7UA56_9ACTN|nr:hypothetical protein [Nocardioides mangrovi]MBZ5737578.1 hypothetical protein [Nocardioides mangrovi]